MGVVSLNNLLRSFKRATPIPAFLGKGERAAQEMV